MHSIAIGSSPESEPSPGKSSATDPWLSEAPRALTTKADE